MTSALEKLDLTASQGQVLGFLAYRKEPACARDIEEHFKLSHPTVSGLLSRLEKKGFIQFRPDEKDRRCKRIHILPKGHECLENIHQTILENEKRVVDGFSLQEQEQFAQFLNRAISNMGGNPCRKPTHKEETTE